MANKRTPEQWLELINKQQQSGLTISTFCRENHISTSCFYTYRAQLTQSAKPEFIQAVTALEPQTIATYLYDTANSFHKFYSDCRVITEDLDLTQSRIALIKGVKIVLSNGLSILGITAPERM